jgi:predicted translin family RNA/ssDNA-binding protein
VDYPDALTGGLRRSTDALRAVLERTRGDITNAIVLNRFDQTVSGNQPRPPS